jgi:hypothetical protein
MTEIDDNGLVAGRRTETMGYPLPPEPPRFQPKWNHYRQYMLPSPSTGRPTAFARATTVSGTLDDTYNLNRWMERTKVAAVVGAMDAGTSDMAELVRDLRNEIHAGNGSKVNVIVDTISDLSGGRDAAELGTAVHAWLEAVDIGQIRPADVPERFQPYLTAYHDVLTRHALEPVPEYVERIVLNDAGEETVVGTLDRIYRVVTTGELVVGDLKTSKSLDHSWLSYAVQFAIYSHARLMLKVDGSGWEAMPSLNTESCFCLHVPSDQPERASCVTYDLAYGLKGMHTALEVRDLRRNAKKAVPFVHAIPTPSPEALRYAAARRAIQNISHPDDLPGLWEQYQDVWTDALTTLGMQIAALFTEGE